ncbi:hypothetical protein [Lysobacter silvisoli]|uniref:Uncharacterized protein n=1 Tax=Lysobacter silvisoli TaxID=2293254 RepID=A0A371JWG8_9GAMM|nr:hypothetical protein [Lysobacter silvisoli]RDZ26019.1 hypothetical protein DX914_19350 [Lysobacter silvisoli]
MLWEQYVYRRGNEVFELWDGLFSGRDIKPLYIGGRGFDVRSQAVLAAFVASVKGSAVSVQDAKQLLIGFSGYRLDDDIKALTETNTTELTRIFSEIGTTEELPFGGPTEGDEEISTSNALRAGVAKVQAQLDGYTDVILDISSLPRIVYLTLLTSLLNHFIPNKEIDPEREHPLVASGVNFQVLVGEDAALDAHIRAEDPSNELVLIPGYSAVLQLGSLLELPLVWFPILGENRVNQLEKVLNSDYIPARAEVCPVVPHPSKDPRRADRLLVEYSGPLFDTGLTTTSSVLYAHESHPFEAYRQLLSAMRRYRDSMLILGGCRLVVTPLGSKLITLGAGLACFEMHPENLSKKYGVGIPYAEPTRYVASAEKLTRSSPIISALVLTGEAYGITPATASTPA